MSPDDLPIDSTTREWTINTHLCTVQASIFNQIAQVTRGILAIDQAQHSIANQLRDTLQVSSCLILQSDDRQQQSLQARIGASPSNSKIVTADCLYNLSIYLNQYYHSELTQGRPVIIPESEARFLPGLLDWVRDYNFSSFLIVPLLYRQSYLGSLTLYPCEQQRTWRPEEIGFVQSIADCWAIVLTLAELEQQVQTTQETPQVMLPDEQREIEKRLRALCNSTSLCIGLLTLEGLVLEMNQTALDFAGVQSAQILGHPFWEMGWWRPSNTTIRRLQQAIAAAARGQVIRYDVDVLGQGQRSATLDFSLKPLRDETGQVVQLIFEGRDITDYKQAQSELQASEARNRALLEAIPDAIGRVTRDGIVLDWKSAKNDALPLPKSEMIGKHLHQVLPTKIAGLIWEHVELALEISQIQIVEYQLWLNGKSCDVEARIVKSGTDEVAVIMQDISERIQARAILQQVNEALEIRVQERTAALRAANQALKAEIAERQRAEEGIRFLYSITQAIFESQDFQTALSVALQNVCEATNWDFGEAWVPKADGSALEFSCAWSSPIEALGSFQNASKQFTFLFGTGLPGRIWVSKQPEWQSDVSTQSSEIYIRAHLARKVGLKTALGIPIIANHTVLAVLVFYRFESQDEDWRLIERISAATELGLMIQRKRTEGEIRQALAKEQELTELKSRFITMASHEFRTPLTTIQSSAELLEHYSNRWTPEKKLTHLHRIQSSVKHMTRLLNDVLIIGKADAGKLKLNPMPLELDYFCRKLVEEVQLYDSKQHAITFTCDCQLETKERQYGDRETHNDRDTSTSSRAFASQFPSPCMDKELLEQILDNLLSNAIKYSPPGSNVELTLCRFADRAIFKISDHGIGIPSDDQKRLFEAFHRATNVGTIPGTGLGLAIVKKCVDVHQGQIAVESEVGVGTTFTVTLPIYNSLSTHEKNSSH